MHTPTHTREAQLSDLDAVAPLFDLYRQFYDQAPDALAARAFIASRLQRRDAVILLAEQAGLGAVGFAQLYPSFCSIQARPIYVLSDLFVHPDARRSGAGRVLMQAAEARGQADGVAHLELTTARTNLRAQALYASQGWVRDEVYFGYSKGMPPA